jgi:hypothetical protein
MSQPHLTFACELDPARLTELFADGAVIAQLQALTARVIVMVSDFSQERAEVVKQLNQAQIPLVAVPLFPAEEGYYFTVANATRAAGRYEEWKRWSAERRLKWDWVGLDIEPEAEFYEQIMADPWRLPRMLLPRLRDHDAPSRARERYSALIEQIHRDGWQVENYQFPLIADERKAGSTLLQRLLGLVDVHTDREVWMLYNSFVRSLGPGILWSYGPGAEAIALGTTGGGPDIPGHPQMPSLSWEEFARDLRLARHFTDQVYVHSLEGCVWQGFLERLRSFDWSGAVPPSAAPAASGIRRLLQAALWSSAHRVQAAGIAAGFSLLLRRAWSDGR